MTFVRSLALVAAAVALPVNGEQFALVTQFFADGSERRFVVDLDAEGGPCRGAMEFWPDGLSDARLAPPPLIERCDAPKRRAVGGEREAPSPTEDQM